jgi:hypothetical protein
VKLHNASDVAKFLCIVMNVSHLVYSSVRVEVVRNFIELQVGEMDKQTPIQLQDSYWITKYAFCLVS